MLLCGRNRGADVPRQEGFEGFGGSGFGKLGEQLGEIRVGLNTINLRCFDQRVPARRGVRVPSLDAGGAAG